MVTTKTRVRRIYRKGGVNLSEKIDYNAKSYCSFLQKKTNDGKNASDMEVVCPHCGAIQKRDNLIDGCDYCKNAFSITDSSSKISAFHVFHDVKAATDSKLEFLNKLRTISMSVVFIMLIMASVTLAKDYYLIADVFKKISIIVGEIAIAGVIIYSMAAAYIRKHRGAKYADTEE